MGVVAASALAQRGLLAPGAEAGSLRADTGSDLFSGPLTAPDFDLDPEIDAVVADPGRLGELYAAGLHGEDRKRRGVFYTPRHVADAALDALPPSVGPALHPRDRVLDPACGGGRFLIAACDRLAPHVPAVELLGRLHGRDTDPLAVAVTRAALYLRLVEHPGQRLPLSRTIREGDLLAEHGAGDQGADLYDAVVGNPPYRGGRFSPLSGLGTAERRRFRAAEYQVDPYVLFIEAALARLRRGGELALVVPNTFMSNLRTAALRGLLASENRLEAVLELPASTFGAGVETVVIRAMRGGRTPLRVPVMALEDRHASGLAPCGPTRTATHPAGTLIVPDGDRQAPWPLLRPGAPPALLTGGKDRAGAGTLGDVAEVTRGVNPYHHTTHTPAEIAKRVHHAASKLGPEYVPELRGRDLQPFRTAWNGRHWIRYGPWLKEPRDPRFFDGPRLLVRKILGETLVSAYLDTPFCADQSVYIARLRDGQPWPPLALLACVSCQAVADLLRARHQEHDTLFPQLKVAELRALPLPPVAPDAPAVQALAGAVAAFLAAGAPDDQRPAIDAAAAALYGV